MVQALLADRFAIATHHETRELPIYNLVLAKGGAKFQPSKRDRHHHRTRAVPACTSQAATTPSRLLARELAAIARPALSSTKTGTSPAAMDLTLRWTPDDAPPPLLNGANPIPTPRPASSPPFKSS